MNCKISFYTPPYTGINNYFDMVDTAVRHNVASIEGFSMLDFASPDVEAAKRVREYADSKDIKFSCFSVYINVVGNDSDEMVAKLNSYADVAAVLGSPYLHHTIANEFSDPRKIMPYKDELFAKGISAVQKVYDYADSIGIKAIYEEQGYLFNGIDGYSRFIDAVDRNIGVVADFANIYQAGDTVEDFVKAFGDRVVHAHIKDITLTDTNPDGNGLLTLSGKYMNEAQVGRGMVNIKQAIELLCDKGYDGHYGIEYGFCNNSNTSLINDTLTLIDSWLQS